MSSGRTNWLADECSKIPVYNLPHTEKLRGVIKTAASVAIAVRLTDKATFPLASEEIKLEILPPGQAATKIIPRPMVGEM